MHTSTVMGQLNLRNGQGSQDPWPSVFLRLGKPGHKCNAESSALVGRTV